MPRTLPSTAPLRLLAALALISGCRSAAPAAGPPDPRRQPAGTAQARADTARTVVQTGVRLVQSGVSAMQEFTPDVPAVDSGGECMRGDDPSGGALRLTAYFPTRVGARAVVSMSADTAGRVLQYSERRGLVTMRGMGGGTSPAERDSLFRAAQAATRSTTFILDYTANRAFLINSGGGRPDQTVAASVSEIENLPRLGKPAERSKRVQELCGVSLGAPLRGTGAAVSRPPGSSRFLRGWTSGRTRLSDRVGAVWVLDADTANVRIRALFLIRGDSGWLRDGVGSRARVMYPPMPEATGELSGARVDTVWLRLDREANIAWVHNRKVPLADGNNVIFVDHGDGKGGPLTVTRVTRTSEVLELGIEMAYIPDAIRGVVVGLPGWIDFFAGR